MNHNGNFLKRTLCATLACVVFLGCFVPSIRAETIGTEDLYDLILEVKHNKRTLSNAVIGMERDGEFFLPVLELAGIFDFAANVDFAAGSVTGFFLREENEYGLNVHDHTYSYRGKTQSFPEGEAFVLEQKYGIKEVYISAELLSKIWPISINFNNLLQIIEVTSSEKLPYQVKQARERERGIRLRRLEGSESAEDENGDVQLVVKNKPKLFSLPALNVNAIAQWSQDNGRHQESVNINGGNDLLYGEVDYSLRLQNDTGDGADKGIQDVRFKYTKRAYDDEDLPLNIKLLEVGDVSSQTASLAQGSLNGRGVVFTNASHTQKINFDSLTVDGVTEPGWEVELYRNNQLLGYQVASDTGEYLFEDVQLNYNRTVIKVMLYGPQGQTETREEIYNISRDMLRPGETIYEVGILDSDRNLLALGDENVSRESGFTKNLLLQHGLNSNLTAFGSLADVPTDVGSQRFGSLGLKFALFETVGAVEAYRSLDGGSALEFKLSRRFLDTNLNLRTAILDDFESNIIGYGDDADVFRFRGSANRSFKLPKGNLGLQLSTNYERRHDGSSQMDFDTGQSLSLGKIRFSNSTSSSFKKSVHANTRGLFSLNYNFLSDWKYRGAIDYSLYPFNEINNARSEVRYRDPDGLTAALDLDYNLKSKTTKIGTQLGYDFGLFSSSVDLDWHSESGVRALLRTRFSMAPYGPKSSYIYDAKSMVNRSNVTGRVFYDNDYDGVYSDGDTLAPDAKFKVGKTESRPSGANGITSYVGQNKLDYEAVTLDLDNVGDPYVISNQAEFKTILRPATSQTFDFPIIKTGIVEGVVYDHEGPVSSIGIQLMNKNHEIVETTKTAFDGYYSFEYIRPGDYIVQVDPAITQVSIPPRSVSVTSEDLFQFGIDLHTLEQATEVACVESAHEGRVTQNCHNAGSTLAGIEKPALGPTGEDTSGIRAVQNNGGTSSVRVSQVRIGEYTDKIRIVLDLSAPTAIRVWEQSDRKQVSIDIQDVAWDAMQNWVSKNPHLIKDFKVLPLGQNGATITINALHKIEVAEKMMLTPNGKDFYRFYIDFKQCANGCK
jgi:hypothetical protein